MDFARKQLEKYGWTDGKGLGRHENGISEALKPKLKRSAAGIGHDAASEFNEHWWTALYDKAAGNVEVQNKNGKTKKIKTKNVFQITNSTWKLKQKPKEEENDKQYSEYFVRTAVLTNGGSKVEKVKESESESEEEKKDVFKMTDEELFKICEGRTAHKGARHGLKATGKLARIAEQEALLLTEPRFSGYSHAKKLTKNKVAEESNFDIDSEVPKSKKKKKRKYCHSNEKLRENSLAKAHELPMSVNDVKQHDDVISVIKENRVNKKSKYENKKSFSCHEVEEEIVEIVKTTELEKKITKKRNTHIQQQKK